MGRSPPPPGAGRGARRRTRRPLGAAAVRRHRELRPPRRPRPPVDVRQGRLRRARRRDGADAGPRRDARASARTPGPHDWTAPLGRNLLGARVSILGGGGITESLVRLLQPWDCHITVVRRTANHLDGVDDVLEADRYADALPGADLVVLALALTPETEGIIAADELSLMEDHAWLVNVARGRHVVTDDLVDALRDGVIGGAGLDVTDPEPLPHDHPLWSMPNCLITPHVGNTPEMARPLLAERIRAQRAPVRRGRRADRTRRRRRRVLTWPARRGRTSTPVRSSGCSPTTIGARSSPRSSSARSSADDVADAQRPARRPGQPGARPPRRRRARRRRRRRWLGARRRRVPARRPGGARPAPPRRARRPSRTSGARCSTAFVRDGRITSMPAARAKRLVVLDWLAQAFEPGRALQRARGQRDPRRPPPGHGGAAPRTSSTRAMLDRAGGEYWRSGGSVT